MADGSRPKGRRTTTRAGTSDPGGAVVPEPRIRHRAGAARGDADAGDPQADDIETHDPQTTDPQTHDPQTTDPQLGDASHSAGAAPAEVVHLIPAEHLDEVDTMGMSMPIGVGDSASAVRLPGDTVLTRPDESDIPTDEELDRRDAAKGGRRKRTGPPPPSAATPPDPDEPPETAPPPTDPVDPA
jgi:hypothetical protein